MKLLVETVVSKARESNVIITMASASTIKKNLLEGIIKTINVLTLETMFKRGEIYGCYTTTTINVDRIIRTPRVFMMSDSMIKVVSFFPLIMNIGSCQSPLQGKVIPATCKDLEALKAACILKVLKLYLSYSNVIRASQLNLISPPFSQTSMNFLDCLK